MVSLTLKKARQLVAGAWSPTLCKRLENGWPVICSPEDPQCVLLDLSGAIQRAAEMEQEGQLFADAYLFLDGMLPETEGGIELWSSDPSRKESDVLALLDSAILRAVAAERSQAQ